jgi:hypothetical protein
MALWESLSERSVVMNKRFYSLFITVLVYSLLLPLILKCCCFAQENIDGEIMIASPTLQAQGLEMLSRAGYLFVKVGDQQIVVIILALGLQNRNRENICKNFIHSFVIKSYYQKKWNNV